MAAAARVRASLARALGRSAPLSTPAVPAALADLARSGPAPPAPARPGAEEHLRLAVVIPSFRRGSGGHSTIVRLLQALRERGHEVSVWLEDCEGRHVRESPQLTAASFAEFFSADGIEFHADMRRWAGADVVLATGWQTVARSLLLKGVTARAYLVQDHEPDFYPASAEALWAAQSYRQGLYCIAASPWLAELLRGRYGAQSSHFDLALDHTVYRPLGGPRSRQSVLFYARAVTPRRAVPLGLLALAELARRRPGLDIALYGEDAPLNAPFPCRQLGVLDGGALAALYGQASVGMVLSLTNPSLIGLEMMACGLPCVELASDSMLASFGTDGPLQLTAADPSALCEQIDSLLGDDQRRARIADAGLALTAGRSWDLAGEQVERALLTALQAPR